MDLVARIRRVRRDIGAKMRRWVVDPTMVVDDHIFKCVSNATLIPTINLARVSLVSLGVYAKVKELLEVVDLWDLVPSPKSH